MIFRSLGQSPLHLGSSAMEPVASSIASQPSCSQVSAPQVSSYLGAVSATILPPETSVQKKAGYCYNQWVDVMAQLAYDSENIFLRRSGVNLLKQIAPLVEEVQEGSVSLQQTYAAFRLRLQNAIHHLSRRLEFVDDYEFDPDFETLSHLLDARRGSVELRSALS